MYRVISELSLFGSIPGPMEFVPFSAFGIRNLIQHCSARIRIHHTLWPGGHKEMSSILADQQRPHIWAQMRGGAMSTAVRMEPK